MVRPDHIPQFDLIFLRFDYNEMCELRFASLLLILYTNCPRAPLFGLGFAAARERPCLSTPGQVPFSARATWKTKTK